MLFTIPRDPAAERWNGPRIGACDDVAKHFGLDVRPTSELPEFLEGVLPGMEAVVLPAERQGVLRPALEGLPEPVRERFARLLRTDVAADAIAAPLRLRKSPAEIALMRRACSATANALNDAMSQLRANPGGSVPERAIESIIEYSCKRRGADRMAFPSVVAGGANGTVLHYMANSQRIPPGSLVMVDAGCELSGYSADVSRTWPVSGIFTPPQRDLYSLVLDVQKRLIANTVPGSSLDELHVQAATELAQGLLDLGFLKGETLESALASGKYAKYYPHATGHFLGMDVHDTHSVRKDVPLEVAMVVTIEPGLYVDPSDEGAPEEFRGIGIRIEDDVLVGASGSKAEVLSGEAFKEVRDIEELVGSARHKWNVE